VAGLQAAVSTGYSRGKFEGLLDQPVSVLARVRPLKTISVAIADFETGETASIHDAGRHVDFTVIGVGNGDALGTLLGLAAGRTAQCGLGEEARRGTSSLPSGESSGSW
jgi:hypothetical protein